MKTLYYRLRRKLGLVFAPQPHRRRPGESEADCIERLLKAFRDKDWAYSPTYAEGRSVSELKPVDLEALANHGEIRYHYPNGYIAGRVGVFEPLPPVSQEERVCDPNSEIGMRFNEGKLRYDLLPPDAIEVLVTILTKGAKKYAPRNWEKGLSWSGCNASLMRHQQAWMKGEDRDPESGELHMGHVMWNAMALVAFQLRNVGIDDRLKL